MRATNTTTHYTTSSYGLRTSRPWRRRAVNGLAAAGWLLLAVLLAACFVPSFDALLGRVIAP